MNFPIAPYTDPALDHLAKWIADRLNAAHPGMVRRWIVSEMLSYQVEEYPLLQLHCISSDGEALERCQGSIRYVCLNDQIQLGEQQQMGFRWVELAIASALRQFQYETGFGEYPITIAPQKFKAERRSGVLKLADGSAAAGLTWTEVFFEYGDAADFTFFVAQ